MQHHAEFRRCLVDLDLAGARAIWAAVAPHLPQPNGDTEALATLHLARTSSASIAGRLRFYSHRWLLDRGLPSQLPDRLKPRAERLYPRIAEGVGISVNSKYPEVIRCVRGAMEYAVQDAYADGRSEPAFVSRRMREARQRELRGLGLLKTARLMGGLRNED